MSTQSNLWEGRWRFLRAAPGLIRAHLRLLSVEVNFATSSLRAMAIAVALAFLSVIVLLSVLATGAVLGLIQSGFTLVSSIGIAAILPLLVCVGSIWAAYVRFERMTLPESRKRLRALLDLVDE